jgi:hypothetical protein
VQGIHQIILKCGHILAEDINKSIVQGSGVGPTLYIVHESDLVLISSIKIFT